MATATEQQSSIVATFGTHTQAENAIKELQRAGIDMHQLSVVGRDYHSEEHVVGYYNAGDRMKYWGSLGAFWGGLWGVLFGAAFFWIPGVGPLVVAGPLVSAIVGGLENAAIVGGLSALGAGLFSLGIPKDSILQYEAELKAGKYLLLVHGNEATIEDARSILQNTDNESVEHHEATA